MYSNPAVDIATYLISLADETHTPMTPMKLNILTYICHGVTLATYGEPLTLDPVVARRFGPCIPEVSELTKNGKLPIPDLTQCDNTELHSFDVEIAEEVYKGYGGYSDLDLFQLTRDKGTPWSDTWSSDDSGNAIIDNGKIQDHYSALVGISEPVRMCG